MAMTAWSAKVWISSISRSVKAPASRRVTMTVPITWPVRSMGAARAERHP